MMNRKEFQQYLEETIKDYLPDSYADATITFNEVVKNNDTHLTGISIMRPGESVVPNIYLENFWKDYQNGKDIDEIVGDIADMRIEYSAPQFDQEAARGILNYEVAKDKLQIRLCDTKENQDRLKNLVHTEHSDFSATYHVLVQEDASGTASAPVTHQLMENWGVTVEQLHADALAADQMRSPMLCDMAEMMESIMFGKEAVNLFQEEGDPSGMGMYCLTNGDKMHGAGLILQGDLMQQIGEIVGGDFYILPSSCHEVLVVPESAGISVQELSVMVQQVNQTEVSPEDRLSDHVQHYDCKDAALENAEKRASRLEKEKVETKAAKKSIHARLGEKKEQSAAKKAEKAVDKAVKKDKGQEL
ncbi:MAG: DUF5688 family protein [Eubacteriales bacterium]|nr:DUF5688 family protein [Eubacteriales bacterium]